MSVLSFYVNSLKMHQNVTNVSSEMLDTTIFYATISPFFCFASANPLQLIQGFQNVFFSDNYKYYEKGLGEEEKKTIENVFPFFKINF